ncbi:MAG: sugar transferase [Carboxydocellales bacterium]
MVTMNAKQRKMKWYYIIGDFLGLSLAALLSLLIRFGYHWTEDIFARWYYGSFGLIIGVTMFILYIYKMYDLKYKSFVPQVPLIFRALLHSMLGFWVLSFFVRTISFSRLTFVYFADFAFVLLVLVRFIVNRKIKKLFIEGVGVDRVLSVGISEEGLEVLAYLEEHPEFGFKVVGLVTENGCQKDGHEDIQPVQLDFLGKFGDFSRIIEQQDVSVVFICLKDKQKLKQVVDYCERKYLQIYMVPDILDVMSSPVGIGQIASVPLIMFKESPLLGVQGKFKRMVDLLGGAIGLTLLSPILLLITIAIKVDSAGPVVFFHQRLGTNGRVIEVYKFRTMVQDADKILKKLLKENPEAREEYYQEFKLKDDPRVTKLGAFLRKTSLDELPQFWNVVTGEMSLVGPRPIIPKEIGHYGEYAKMLLRVPPGITGLWQVSGRNDIPYDERVKLDMYYINNWSFWLDLSILLRTVPAILARKGAY